MSIEKGNFYRFESFVLDTKENVLLRHHKPVSLPPKALHLLSVLVAHHGRIVEKDSLMSEVWADSFVEDSNLTFTVRKLRQALGDDAQRPTFIETIPKRGYRFVAAVEVVEDVEQSASISVAAPVADVSTEETVSDSGSLTQGPGSWFRRPQVLAGSIFVALLILSGVGYGLFRLIAGNSAVPFADPNVSRLTSNGNVQTAVVSPDGRFVAYILNENTRHTMWLKNVANGGSVQIELPTEMLFVTALAFAPDGDSVYFGHRSSLYRFPVPAGVPTKIIDKYLGGEFNRITFSPDGKQFAFLSYGVDSKNNETASLSVYDTVSAKERVLAESKRPSLFLRSAAWSPDGKIIACAALSEDGSQQIVGVDVADGSVVSVPSPIWATIRQIAWQPDGNGLFVIGENDDSGFLSQLFLLSFPHGDARNITTDLNDYQSISITRDGQTVVAVRAQQESHIWVTDTDDPKKARRLTTGFQKFDGVYGINWTQDGRIIYETAPSGKTEIWSVNSVGSDARRLAAEGGAMGASPDGRYVVFQSRDEVAGNGFFRLDWSRGEKTRITTGTDLDPAFSPDGKTIVFTRYADDVALWKIGIDGGEAKKLTSGAELPMPPAFSPDGNQIALMRQAAGAGTFRPLCVIDSQTGEVLQQFELPPTTSTQGHNKMAVQWSADGKSLDYLRSVDGVTNVWRQPIDGSPPFAVTGFDTDLIFNFAISLDGKKYALARGSYDRDVFLIANGR